MLASQWALILNLDTMRSARLGVTLLPGGSVNVIQFALLDATPLGRNSISRSLLTEFPGVDRPFPT